MTPETKLIKSRNSVEFAEPPKKGERPQKRSVDYFHLNSTGHDADTPLRSTSDVLRRSEHQLRRFSAVVSTEEQFQEEEDDEFYGKFSRIRNELDYSYHVHYKKDRQFFQDSIIVDLLENTQDTDACITPNDPWLLYTAGVQGTGKTYTIQKLVQQGKLPLLSYVHVDPQEIARRLPEFGVYNRKCPENADNLTKKEVGYITEIAVLAALQAGRNVVLDGALRDCEWWNIFFDKIRHDHDNVKVALLYITAPREDIISRIRKRSLETERIVPEEMIDDILAKLPSSVDAVAPNVDYFAKISNTDKLQLLAPIHEDFDAFQSQFLQTCTWKAGQNHVESTATDTEESQRKASILAIKPMRPLRGRRQFSVIKSTEENHRVDKAEFFGKYAHIRETLDYSYHAHYTRERQAFQDAIISDLLSVAVLTDKDGNLCSTPTEPWLVFTAGAMGAGKSYTMKKLVEAGRFPLLAFVSVDPDIIRRMLPEFHLYVDESPELAGQLTRKESGFIAEILTLAGLQAGKNVLVDGSLRDSDWYKIYFERLRVEFSSLRLAILHVTAPRETVFQRAAHRAITTGRVVPKETLILALEQVPRSVQVLAPLVDYFCELINAPDTPDIELASSEQTWESFEANWIQTCAWVPPRQQFLQESKTSSEKLQQYFAGTVTF